MLTFIMKTVLLSSAELMCHHQATGLSLRAAQPSQPVLQNSPQDGAAQTKSPEPAHHHHQTLLSGEKISFSCSLLVVVFTQSDS